MKTHEHLAEAASLLHGDRWQRSLSHSLGVNERTVRRWAAGHLPVPEWVFERLDAALAVRAEEIMKRLERT